jgi:hypothetical protein
MRVAPLVLGLALVASAAPATAEAPNPTPVPGTYQQADPVTRKPLPTGSQLVIIAGKSGKLGFSINAIRALDSNQGFVAGLLNGPLPLTWTQISSTTGNCRLHFARVPAIPHALAVTQDLGFGDCGFQTGVTANGTYVLIPEKPIKT